MVALAEPPEPADPAPAQRKVRHLHGITLRFCRDQLGRAMATGQAIMLCRSPQEAVRRQFAYMQATLASGCAHAGEVSRLSQDIARDMLPPRPCRGWRAEAGNSRGRPACGIGRPGAAA